MPASNGDHDLSSGVTFLQISEGVRDFAQRKLLLACTRLAEPSQIGLHFAVVLTPYTGGEVHEGPRRSSNRRCVFLRFAVQPAILTDRSSPSRTADVIDTSPLLDQPLRVRAAFATRLLQCGIFSRVVDVLSSTGAITTINNLNTQFEVGAGGFQGSTNPAYVYTVIDAGPNAASHDDVRVLTNSLANAHVGRGVPFCSTRTTQRASTFRRITSS